MTADEIAAEIARLTALLAARTGKTGYIKNCRAIEARLAELAKEQPENV